MFHSATKYNVSSASSYFLLKIAHISYYIIAKILFFVANVNSNFQMHAFSAFCSYACILNFSQHIF